MVESWQLLKWDVFKMCSGSLMTQVRPHGLKIDLNFSLVFSVCSLSKYQYCVFWSEKKSIEKYAQEIKAGMNFQNLTILSIQIISKKWKNTIIKLSKNLSFVILIFETLKFRNFRRSTFRRSKFWPPPVIALIHFR